jgi:hypothetical protein
MSVVVIPIFQMAAKYPALPPTALALNIGAGTVATTAAHGVSFACTGNEIILVQGGAASQVVTVTSVVNGFNRTGNIVYTVGIGLLSVLPQIQPAGFLQSDGTVVITLDSGGTDVKFWCIRLAS